MEVIRNRGPENNFLQKVRDLATQRGIVLVFDECTSGFRETFGGIHKKYSVNPDLAMFGKTLGNGYAIDSCYRPTDLSKYILDDNYRNLFYESYKIQFYQF